MGDKKGDPEGRRLARHRAQLLAEAARVARVLQVLAERAGFDGAGIAAVERALAREEQNTLVRGHGRLEPRTRYKHRSGQPLFEDREINLLFADESGMPGRQPHQPEDCFAVGAVAMDTGQEATYKVAADRVKSEYFGTTDITFHEPEMREHTGRYEFGGDVVRQAEFDAAINRLVGESDFVVFGVGIRKRAFEEEFVQQGLDPYLPFDVYALAIHLLLERYVDYRRDDMAMGKFGVKVFPDSDIRQLIEEHRAVADGAE